MRVVRWSPFDAPLPPPERDIRRLLISVDANGGFESYAAADGERVKRAARLARSSLPGAFSLAVRLSSCAHGARCLSPACPVCAGRVRIWFYGETAKVLGVQHPTLWAQLKLITLVNEGWIVPRSEIQCFSPKILVDRARHQFLRAGATGAIVIGAVHGEFDQTGQYWQPHLHLIAKGMSRASMRLLRQRHYRRSPRVYRPMVVQPLKNPEKQISYLLKSYWPMKVRYIDEEGCKRSTLQRIPEPFQSKYLMMLDQFNLLDLVFLVGVRRYGHALQAMSF